MSQQGKAPVGLLDAERTGLAIVRQLTGHDVMAEIHSRLASEDEKPRLRRQAMTSRSTSGAHAKPQRHPLAHLPGEDGWPILGNTVAGLKHPVRHIQAMHSRHGPVYCDRLFGVRSVAMLGPEANELVLFDRDKNFSSADGWGFLLDRLFPRGLMLMDFDEHRLHRKALGVAFKPAPMKAYLGALNDGILRRIAEWDLAGPGQGGATDLQFYPAIKQLTLDLAATSFLGIELGPQANGVNRAFVDMWLPSWARCAHPFPERRCGRASRGVRRSLPSSVRRSRGGEPGRRRICSPSFAARPRRTDRCSPIRRSPIT